MIRGKCHVPEDFKDYKWPVTFVALPRVGDKVWGISQDDDLEELEVKAVIHTSTKSFDVAMNRIYMVASVILELGNKGK